MTLVVASILWSEQWCLDPGGGNEVIFDDLEVLEASYIDPNLNFLHAPGIYQAKIAIKFLALKRVIVASTLA